MLTIAGGDGRGVEGGEGRERGRGREGEREREKRKLGRVLGVLGSYVL